MRLFVTPENIAQYSCLLALLPPPFCMWPPENMDQCSLASLYMLRVEADSRYCCSLVLPWYSFSLKIQFYQKYVDFLSKLMCIHVWI